MIAARTWLAGEHRHVGRLGPVLGGLAGLGAGAAGLWVSAGARPYPWPVWAAVHVVGVSFVVAGVVGWLRRPDNRTGRLMTLVGATWYVGDLQTSTQPVLFAVGFCLFYLTAAVFTHVILALPTGRLATPAERYVVAGLYVAVTVTQVLRFVTEDPVAPQIWGGVEHVSVWAPVGSATGGGLTLLGFGLVLRRWRIAGRPARRQLAALWSTGAVVGGIALAWIAAVLTHGSDEVERNLLFAFSLAMIVVPFAILAGLVRVRLARMQVADLVVRLQADPAPDRLRDALAEALGDPGLQVWFPLPDGGYTSTDGRTLGTLPAEGNATTVEAHGEPLAVLVHDPALADQAALMDSVVAAARFALDNARLYATQRAQLEQTRASRARIVAAADDERRRIQRDLHDGAQHKLLAISVLIGQTREVLPDSESTADAARRLDTASAQLREVVRELRDLTEGIDPPALTEQGLAAVLESLAERAPIPIEYDAPPRRWPPAVERTAYFVINEALANVYKHAHADRAVVRVETAGPMLIVSIADNGSGGARSDSGSGLRGLRDRVAAVGGTLDVTSSSEGTYVKADLPCG